MRDDGTMLGIIATKAFPAEHLSEQMYVPSETEERKTFIVIKLEYAPLAYFALRQVAIHLLKTQQTLEIKDAETDEAVKTFNVVMAYINGPNFQQSINHIDRTIKDAQEARNCLTQMRTYINTNIDKSIKFQNSIEENLNRAKDLIWKLRELLNSSTSDTPDFK
jgi:intergrase/recombinase